MSKKIKDNVRKFLEINFPQIKMHGGGSSVNSIKTDENGNTIVTIQLFGACDGCGLSPMTTQAIKNRLPQQIDEVDEVIVNIEQGRRDFNRDVEAPF